MDWETRLAADTMEQLQQRARNAAAVLSTQPDTPRAQEADRLLRLIECERARRSLPGNIASFLEAYPLGFDDPEFLRKERNDKVAASDACRAALIPDAFVAAAAADPRPLALEVKRIVSMTNLIQGSFEKPKLFETLQDPNQTRRFLAELGVLLHGHSEAPERLEAFSDYLHTLGLRKWTYGTYFLFLSDPERCTFVKPEGLKRAVEIAGYALDYDPAPSAVVYRQVLAFADWVRSHLKQADYPHLMPKDLIDVQSFIWHMAPTGKFAR